MDTVYKTSYSIDRLIQDSKIPLLAAYIREDWGSTKAMNTYIGFNFEVENSVIENGFNKENWRIIPFQKDYNLPGRDVAYYKTEFKKIFNSRIMLPAAIYQMEPINPKSDSILIYFLKESISEYKISQGIEGLTNKNNRDSAIALGKQKYNLNDYKPENTAFFKKFYKRWVELFAGDYFNH